jgi:hypothetical protein
MYMKGALSAREIRSTSPPRTFFKFFPGALSGEFAVSASHYAPIDDFEKSRFGIINLAPRKEREGKERHLFPLMFPQDRRKQHVQTH